MLLQIPNAPTTHHSPLTTHHSPFSCSSRQSITPITIVPDFLVVATNRAQDCKNGQDTADRPSPVGDHAVMHRGLAWGVRACSTANRRTGRSTIFWRKRTGSRSARSSNSMPMPTSVPVLRTSPIRTIRRCRRTTRPPGRSRRTRRSPATRQEWAAKWYGYLEMIGRGIWRTALRKPPIKANREGPAESAHVHPIKSYLNLPLTAPQAGFLLKMDQAIELGVINSPQYQSFREQLYLAALPVTQQRFSFAYQWAATADWIRDWAGGKTTGGPLNNWTGTSTIGFNKLATARCWRRRLRQHHRLQFHRPDARPDQRFEHQPQPGRSRVPARRRQGGDSGTADPGGCNLFYQIRGYARFREVQCRHRHRLKPAGQPGSASGSGTSSGPPISTLAALGIASN